MLSVHCEPIFNGSFGNVGRDLMPITPVISVMWPEGAIEKLPTLRKEHGKNVKTSDAGPLVSKFLQLKNTCAVPSLETSLTWYCNVTDCSHPVVFPSLAIVAFCLWWYCALSLGANFHCKCISSVPVCIHVGSCHVGPFFLYEPFWGDLQEVEDNAIIKHTNKAANLILGHGFCI